MTGILTPPPSGCPTTHPTRGMLPFQTNNKTLVDVYTAHEEVGKKVGQVVLHNMQIQQAAVKYIIIYWTIDAQPLQPMSLILSHGYLRLGSEDLSAKK